MSLIRPFAGLRPLAARAREVAAPPYDVLSTHEARVLAAGNPWSFLHISKPEIDLAAETNPYSTEVYQTASANFARMIDAGVLQRDTDAHYYFYRLTMGAHTQTGLVAAARVADYVSNRIRKHEFTRPDKEDDRVRQIDALNAQTGPVFLTYRRDAAVDAIAAQITAALPEIDVELSGWPGNPASVRHCVWAVRDAVAIKTLTETFDAMPALYIADGHHRSAAAARIAALRRATNPRHRGDEAYNFFLAVMFPDNQMQILDYNRVVRDLNGMDSAAFIARVGANFRIEKLTAAVKPTQAGEFGMYLEGRWYRLRIKPELVPKDDPVRRLDVSLLADCLIAPILGINDPRRDKRIDFVGGIRGVTALQARVDSGEMAVAFSMFPTSLADLMAVADVGAMMPPKSTWFEPKLADGLVSHLLD